MESRSLIDRYWFFFVLSSVTDLSKTDLSSAFSLIYMKLPEDFNLNTVGDEYVGLLKKNLEALRPTVTACIASKEYQRASTLSEDLQNIY